MGATKAFFQSMGTSPRCSERGKKAERHGESGSANPLRTRAGMLAGSDTFRAFSFSRSSVTPATEIVIGRIPGRLGPPAMG